jgi:hypothetical protein
VLQIITRLNWIDVYLKQVMTVASLEANKNRGGIKDSKKYLILKIKRRRE